MLRNHRTFYWIFAGLAVAAAACWIFNLAYYREGQLEKPVFLTHYIETENDEGTLFDLYVLENLEEEQQIAQIRIPGLERAQIAVSSRSSYRNQELVKYTVQLAGESADDVRFTARSSDWPLVFKQIEVDYADGTRSTENIGEIHLYPRPSAEPVLTVPQSMSSNGQEGQSTLQAEEDLRITGVDTGFEVGLGSRLELYWGDEVGEWDFDQPLEEWGRGSLLGEAKFPMELKKGGTTKLGYRFLDQADDDWATVYRLMPRIRTESSDGTSRILSVFVDYAPYPDEQQIRRFIKERREES
ncbi:hypothetical protein [Saccharibacillus qingshengii]|uniref:hypothetical protein n=1 Tax=Saccharibacillus qingshengii TaxID=1763540 RepID=UPI0015543A23|nr:hypothetical protein [Saccharibacillus qingshengii]